MIAPPSRFPLPLSRRRRALLKISFDVGFFVAFSTHQASLGTQEGVTRLRFSDGWRINMVAGD